MTTTDTKPTGGLRMVNAATLERQPLRRLRAGNPASQPPQVVPTRSTGSWRRYSLADVMGAELAPLVWTVDGLIPEGMTILAGAQKMGKSWFMLDLAMSVAAGTVFLGQPTAQGNALYLALEDNARRIQRRVSQILGGARVPGGVEVWHLASRLGGGLEDEIARWVDTVENPRLVIVDTLGRVQPVGGESGDGGYGDRVNSLAPLQAYASQRGIAVLVAHHTKKLGDNLPADPVETILGSQGIAATADTILILNRPRGGDQAELFVTGREIDHERTDKIWFDREVTRWRPGDGPELDTLVINAVAGSPGRTTNEVAKAVRKRKEDVSVMLDGLLLQGRVTRQEGPNRSHLWFPAVVPPVGPAGGSRIEKDMGTASRSTSPSGVGLAPPLGGGAAPTTPTRGLPGSSGEAAGSEEQPAPGNHPSPQDLHVPLD